jgi:hypothetical protein
VGWGVMRETESDAWPRGAASFRCCGRKDAGKGGAPAPNDAGALGWQRCCTCTGPCTVHEGGATRRRSSPRLQLDSRV